MPGRAEYGLLGGFGQGLAQVGQIAYADHLQKMRDERLAKIAAEAAEGKFARDKELIGIEAASRRELSSDETLRRREELEMKNKAELGLIDARVKAEVSGKKELADYYTGLGLKADGSAAKEREWKTIKSKADGMEETVTGVSDGTQFIDFTTPVGQRAKILIDMGKPVGVAVSEAIRLTTPQPQATNTGGDSAANSGALLPPRGTEPISQQVAEKQGLFSMWNEALRAKAQQKRAEYEQLQANNGNLVSR